MPYNTSAKIIYGIMRKKYVLSVEEKLRNYINYVVVPSECNFEDEFVFEIYELLCIYFVDIEYDLQKMVEGVWAEWDRNRNRNRKKNLTLCEDISVVPIFMMVFGRRIRSKL